MANFLITGDRAINIDAHGLAQDAQPGHCAEMDNFCVGQEVIVRTQSAGVWFGVLRQKKGAEVILENARRMWKWHCKESISLSGIVRYGINRDKSIIAPYVTEVWVEAIEIMPICGDSAESIRGADDAKQF